MSGQQLERYRKRLQELADGVGRIAAALEDEVRAPLGGGAGGGLSNAPMHLGDLGSEAFTQELDATLLENETYIRDEAVAALRRIDAGTFGRCEVSGDIGAARLVALPYARQCVACAATGETGRAVNLNAGRPASWLGGPGHEAQTGGAQRIPGHDLGGDAVDTHAAGPPGGGAGAGGRAGTNVGSGSPGGANLASAMGSGPAEAAEDPDDGDSPSAESGLAGGAVGGTPANKRATGKESKAKSAKPGAGPTKQTKRTKE